MPAEPSLRLHRHDLGSLSRDGGRRGLDVPWFGLQSCSGGKTIIATARSFRERRYFPSCKIASAIFSAVISVGKLVLAQGTTGKIEASTTRKPSTPRTRPWGSVTAMLSPYAPMRAL